MATKRGRDSSFHYHHDQAVAGALGTIKASQLAWSRRTQQIEATEGLHRPSGTQGSTPELGAGGLKRLSTDPERYVPMPMPPS